MTIFQTFDAFHFEEKVSENASRKSVFENIHCGQIYPKAKFMLFFEKKIDEASKLIHFQNITFLRKEKTIKSKRKSFAENIKIAGSIVKGE